MNGDDVEVFVAAHVGHVANEYRAECVACRIAGHVERIHELAGSPGLPSSVGALPDPAVEAAREFVFRSSWSSAQRVAIQRAASAGATIEQVLAWIDDERRAR